MICVVLHCDGDGCDREQGYPMSTLSQHGERPDVLETAMRLGAQTGWQIFTDPEVEYVALCPECRP